MVNYQGPWFLRFLTDTMRIPIFDRIQEVHYRAAGTDTVSLTAGDVNQLTELRSIHWHKKNRKEISPEEEADLVRRVPPGRRGEIRTHNQNQDLHIALVDTGLRRGASTKRPASSD